jgi:hypothetical protein
LDELPSHHPRGLLDYRVTELERRFDDLGRTLRQDYLTGDQVSNRFVSRKDLRDAATGRREWWPIVLGASVVLMQVAQLVLAIRGGH